MGKIDEAFERFCTKECITSEQYKEDIKPAFEAGYRSGAASQQRLEDRIARLEDELKKAKNQISLDGWGTSPDRTGF